MTLHTETRLKQNIHISTIPIHMVYLLPIVSSKIIRYIAMEHGPFEDVFPIEDGDFQPAMLVYQRVLPTFCCEVWDVSKPIKKHFNFS